MVRPFLLWFLSRDRVHFANLTKFPRTKQSEERMAKIILLTGAGFTRNFGGFLAEDMWAYIFNHPLVQQQQFVKELMLDDFDYESIYNKILFEPTGRLYNFVDREAIKKAVFDSYIELDKSIQNPSHAYPVNHHNFMNFIERFADRDNETCYFFTLNQDIYMERHFTASASCRPLTLPGVLRKPNPADNNARKQDLRVEDFITLPNEEEVNRIKTATLSSSEFHYVKLHGSFNWKSSNSTDVMVIGENKEDAIRREPILSWYFEIFRKVLAQSSVKLLVLGYSFRDKHINEIIADSLQLNGLRLYVLSPEKPSKFKERVAELPEGNVIWEGLNGYFNYNLAEIFPDDPIETPAHKVIIKRLF